MNKILKLVADANSCMVTLIYQWTCTGIVGTLSFTLKFFQLRRECRVGWHLTTGLSSRTQVWNQRGPALWRRKRRRRRNIRSQSWFSHSHTGVGQLHAFSESHADSGIRWLLYLNLHQFYLFLINEGQSEFRIHLGQSLDQIFPTCLSPQTSVFMESIRPE